MYAYHLGQSVSKSPVNQSNSSEGVALNVSTHKNQNNFCWMPLILQNSSRWKTLSIMSYTKPWDIKIGLDPDQWWRKCHLNTYSKARGGHYFMKYTQVYGPNFQRGIWWGKNQKKKDGSLGEKWDFTHKKGVFSNNPNKMCLVKNSDGNFWKVSYFF